MGLREFWSVLRELMVIMLEFGLVLRELETVMREFGLVMLILGLWASEKSPLHHRLRQAILPFHSRLCLK